MSARPFRVKRPGGEVQAIWASGLAQLWAESECLTTGEGKARIGSQTI